MTRIALALPTVSGGLRDFPRSHHHRWMMTGEYFEEIEEQEDISVLPFGRRLDWDLKTRRLHCPAALGKRVIWLLRLVSRESLTACHDALPFLCPLFSLDRSCVWKWPLTETQKWRCTAVRRRPLVRRVDPKPFQLVGCLESAHKPSASSCDRHRPGEGTGTQLCACSCPVCPKNIRQGSSRANRSPCSSTGVELEARERMEIQHRDALYFGTCDTSCLRKVPASLIVDRLAQNRAIKTSRQVDLTHSSSTHDEIFQRRVTSVRQIHLETRRSDP